MHKKMTILKKLSEYDKLNSTDEHILKNTQVFFAQYYIYIASSLFTRNNP